MTILKRNDSINEIKAAITILFLIIIFVKSDFLLFGQQANAQKFLSNLKVGEWITFKGTVQSDSTILVHEIKVIYGEVEDDDWEISGKISRVVPEEKKIFVLLLPVIFDKDTEYEKALESFSDINSGSYVEIEGSFLQDGTFLAAEIGREKLKKDEENMVEWKGKVQAVHPEKNSLTILQHTVFLTPETKIKSLVPN